MPQLNSSSEVETKQSFLEQLNDFESQLDTNDQRRELLNRVIPGLQKLQSPTKHSFLNSLKALNFDTQTSSQKQQVVDVVSVDLDLLSDANTVVEREGQDNA